jgi:hypothetical protein
LNLRPSGYEPDELPGCSTPRRGGRVCGVWGTGVAGDGCCGRRMLRAACVAGGGCGRGMGGWGLGEPGGDLLFHALRRSTIGAEGFHGRVRDGIGCLAPRCGHQAGQASLRSRAHRRAVWPKEPPDSIRGPMPPGGICAPLGGFAPPWGDLRARGDLRPLGGGFANVPRQSVSARGGRAGGGAPEPGLLGLAWRLPLHAGGLPGSGAARAAPQARDRAGSSD